MDGQGFEERTCYICDGTGRHYDSTNADKINPDRSGVCFHCRGEGFTLHRSMPAVVPILIERNDHGDPNDPVYAWLFETTD